MHVRVLSPSVRSAKITDMVTHLPMHILDLIARQPALRTVQIAAQVEDWLPADIPSATSREWVNAILEWFESHGDLSIERGRWTCAPPYAVAFVESDEVRFFLFGESRFDLVLGSSEIACRIELKPRRLIQSETGVSSDWGKPAVGIEREVIALPEDWEDLKNTLTSEGLAIIEIQEWQRQLPNLDHLQEPSANQLDEISTRPKGQWEYYQPRSKRTDRWEAIDGDWQVTTYRLIRWRWEDSRTGQQNAVYYWHASDRHGVEIFGDYLRLWQLRLDRDTRSSRTMIWRDAKLRVPRLIPSMTQTWLRMLSSDIPQTSGQYILYPLRSEHISLVHAVLQEKLGLIISDE